MLNIGGELKLVDKKFMVMLYLLSDILRIFIYVLLHNEEELS